VIERGGRGAASQPKLPSVRGQSEEDSQASCWKAGVSLRAPSMGMNPACSFTLHPASAAPTSQPPPANFIILFGAIAHRMTSRCIQKLRTSKRAERQYLTRETGSKSMTPLKIPPLYCHLHTD
jgi:hypothetical protein